MKRLLISALPILILSGYADAMERHNIDHMSCRQIKSALSDESPAVLRYKSRKIPEMMLFNMLVGSRSDCLYPEAPTRRSVRAKDGSCAIVQCVTPSHSWYRP